MLPIRTGPSVRFFCRTCHGPVEGPAPGLKVHCPACGQRLLVPEPPRATAHTVLGTLSPEAPTEELLHIDPAAVQYVPPAPQAAAAAVAVSNTVVVNNYSAFPHGLHAVITLFLCGLWLPVWLIHYLMWLIHYLIWSNSRR
jgi:hypothetical protein